MIRLLLAEDQGMMRTALSRLLNLEPDIVVVAEAGSGPDALYSALRCEPDVALLDIDMPAKSGLDVARELAEKLPNCRVVIVTTFGRPGYLRQAMEAGARAFVVKDGPVEGLADVVRRVVAGETVIDPSLAAAALRSGANPLTERERDVLRCARNGATLEEVATQLHLSERTVRNYLSAAIQKLGTRNRIEAARVADAEGWL